MTNPIQLRRHDVVVSARELAALLGVSLTEAVAQAIYEKLASAKADAEADRSERRQRALEAIRAIQRLPHIGPRLTDADLYDEDGLPK